MPDSGRFEPEQAEVPVQTGEEKTEADLESHCEIDRGNEWRARVHVRPASDYGLGWKASRDHSLFAHASTPNAVGQQVYVMLHGVTASIHIWFASAEL